MRKITPALTAELKRHVGKGTVGHAEPYHIGAYSDLVKHAARLAYLNTDHLLFFRGQTGDYRNRHDGSTFYPSIYRGDHLPKDAVEQRFDLLKRAGRRLHAAFEEGELEGHTDLGRRQIIQWSVLQHYEVCATPLIDLTQSLRVACSFAQRPGENESGYVYLFGLPHISNRITVNSEHDLVVIRLLSMCPPSALRPYFQEGYLAGTSDITTEYNPKTELDFSRRLIAKFAIPKDDSFWGQGLSRMPDEQLYPPEDAVKDICDVLELEEKEGPPSGDAAQLGDFVAAWTALEQLLLAEAQLRTERVPTAREAIEVLGKSELLEPWLIEELHRLRSLRNEVLHRGIARPGEAKLREATRSIRRIREQLREGGLLRRRRAF